MAKCEYYDFLDSQFTEIKSYSSVRINENLDSWACTGYENFPEGKMKKIHFDEGSGSNHFSDSLYLENDISQNISMLGFDHNEVISEGEM